MRIKNRSRAKPRSDKKYFSNTAKRVKKKNFARPMRGGIRL
jgi:hypothetical protein